MLELLEHRELGDEGNDRRQIGGGGGAEGGRGSGGVHGRIVCGKAIGWVFAQWRSN
jgi:hypothetical protein